MTLAAPWIAVVLAGFLQWRGWGQGRFNWGPRSAALAILLFGTVVFAGTPVAEWVGDGLRFIGDLVGDLLGMVVGARLGDSLGGLVEWLPGVLIGVMWLVALLPGAWFSEAMSWRLAWVGMLLPVFLPDVPGRVGKALVWLVDKIADGVVWAVTAAFGAVS